MMHDRTEMPAWEWLTERNGSEAICREMERSTEALFRYSTDCPVIGPEKWNYIFEKSWKTGGHFPVLYKNDQIYDRREVVACLMMAAGLTMEQADHFLEQISVKEQNYDNRMLYPLHFKEGFFRLVLTWNEKRETKLSFRKAVGYYQEYEQALGKYVTKWAENILERERGADHENENNTDTAYYCGILEPLLNEQKQWDFPYSLRQQDILQRMLVLCAAAERAQEEYERYKDKQETQPDLRQRNTRTRKVSERGTKLCLQVIKKCAVYTEFEDAITCFLEHAVPAMGEAYWRAYSVITTNYAESGGKQYTESSLIERRIFSRKNPDAKKIKRIALFEDDHTQKKVLSKSLRADTLSHYIQRESANTVLLAQLFRPVNRDADAVFDGQEAVSNYSLISEFLGCYTDWLEGKLTQRADGVLREPVPYYRFKRKTVLKYALACGCTTEEEIQMYLEFTGNSRLNPNIPCEWLVLSAVEPGRKYGEKQMIQTIRSRQRMLLYQEAERCVHKNTGETFGIIFETDLKKRIRKLTGAFLYNPQIESFGKKNCKVKKQEMMERYYILLVLCDMLIVMEEQTDQTDVDEIRYEDLDYLEWMNHPGTMVKNYILEMRDLLEWKMPKSQKNPEERKRSSEQCRLAGQILTAIRHQILPLEQICEEHARNLKELYEHLLTAQGILHLFYRESMSEEQQKTFKALQNWLSDACALWTFYGGCQNFSLGWYEKKYHLNHFGPNPEIGEPIPEDAVTWNRWEHIFRNQTQMTEMWEHLAADVSIIRSCYKYLRHKQPQFIRKRCYQKFLANVKEAEKACGCIRNIVERKGTMEMDGFRRKLLVWEKKLTF